MEAFTGPLNSALMVLPRKFHFLHGGKLDKAFMTTS
jgi:hypothetical protein